MHLGSQNHFLTSSINPMLCACILAIEAFSFLVHFEEAKESLLHIDDLHHEIIHTNSSVKTEHFEFILPQGEAVHSNGEEYFPAVS